MTILLTILFVLVCFLLVVVVLLQSGKGGGISGAFGGMGQASQTLFGASGTGNVLTKATSVLGGAFMLLSLLLAIVSQSGPGASRRSVLQEAVGTAPVGAPAELPAPAAEPPASPGPVGGTPEGGSTQPPATGTTTGTATATGN